MYRFTTNLETCHSGDNAHAQITLLPALEVMISDTDCRVGMMTLQPTSLSQETAAGPVGSIRQT